MTTSTAPAGEVGSIVERLRALVAGLPAQDGVAVFGGVYLTVTEAVATHLAAGDVFADPAAVARLDVLFADRFLGAVEAATAAEAAAAAATDAADATDATAAAARPAACWRPLLELRRHPGILPVQFALSGINAHVEHDLPLALLDTCAVLGCAPDDLSADFHRVNDVLAQVEAQVRERLAPAPAELEPDGPLLHLLSSWSIDAARDAAWASTLTLWELRERPVALAAASGALDDGTGLVCRCLLTPLTGPGPH